MVDSRSAGPRPYDVETLDRKTADAVLMQSPHPASACRPPLPLPLPPTATGSTLSFLIRPLPSSGLGRRSRSTRSGREDLSSAASNASLASRFLPRYFDHSHYAPDCHVLASFLADGKEG